MSVDRDLNSQEAASRAALDAVREFLGGPRLDGDGWTFDFGTHLESNWGAVYGGALAAGAVSVARTVVPERSPRALHLQIVRSVPSGVAYATAEVRHAGRTVATVEIDIYDARRKLAVIALATMVAPGAIATEFNDAAADPFRRSPRPVELTAGFTAPLHRSLQMLTDEKDGVFTGWVAENGRPSIDGALPPVGHITIPWDDLESTGPEAACLGADAMIAAPILYSYIPNGVIGPNPDLSLRFTTAAAQREVLTSGTMLSVQHGTVTIAIEVQAGDAQLAHGLATALLLPKR